MKWWCLILGDGIIHENLRSLPRGPVLWQDGPAVARVTEEAQEAGRWAVQSSQGPIMGKATDYGYLHGI